MGEGRRRRWLVVSYFAHESGMACSHHIDDRLPLIRERGVDVTLLSTLIVPKNPAVDHMRVPTLSPSGIRFEVRQYFRKKNLPKWRFELIVTLLLLPVFPFYLLEKAILNIDTTWYWSPLAALRGYLFCRRNRPELVYSTGGPACAHIAAGWIAGWTGIPWVAELQDPLVHSYCARSRAELRLVRWAERYICRKADRVVFLTGEALRRAKSRTGLGNRGVCIYPGARAEIFPEPWERPIEDRLRIVHLGSLAGVRNLGNFLKGMREALGKRPELEDVLRIELYGNVGKDVQQQIREFGLGGQVVLRGAVPRAASIQEMMRADVLLLVQGADEVSAETIPSKLYEYLHARRPIFGLVYRNPELREMLEGMAHVAVDAADSPEIGKEMLRCIERWRQGEFRKPCVPSPFTTNAAVDRLVHLGEEVVARKSSRSTGQRG